MAFSTILSQKALTNRLFFYKIRPLVNKFKNKCYVIKQQINNANN